MTCRPPRILGFRQQQLLAIISADLAEQGRVRPYRAIADALGMGAKSNVCNVVDRLERRGLVRRVGDGLAMRIEYPCPEATQ